MNWMADLDNVVILQGVVASVIGSLLYLAVRGEWPSLRPNTPSDNVLTWAKVVGLLALAVGVGIVSAEVLWKLGLLTPPVLQAIYHVTIAPPYDQLASAATAALQVPNASHGGSGPLAVVTYDLSIMPPYNRWVSAVTATLQVPDLSQGGPGPITIATDHLTVALPYSGWVSAALASLQVPAPTQGDTGNPQLPLQWWVAIAAFGYVGLDIPKIIMKAKDWAKQFADWLKAIPNAGGSA